MANGPPPKPPASKSVFINCPFDDGFKPILRSMVFTIIAAGFYPRCALDATDGADIRVGKIATMIGECLPPGEFYTVVAPASRYNNLIFLARRSHFHLFRSRD